MGLVCGLCENGCFKKREEQMIHGRRRRKGKDSLLVAAQWIKSERNKAAKRINAY